MNDTSIVAVTVPHVIKLTDPEREIEIQLTLTVPDRLTLSEVEEHVNQFLQNTAVFKEKVTEFIEKSDPLVPPVIVWDDRAINEKAANHDCKKCGQPMKALRGISAKNGRPYLGFVCTDRDCKSAFWLGPSKWDYVINTEAVLAFYPDWKPKGYDPVEEPARLTLEEIATIAEKTTVEIKALATMKRHKLKEIISFDAALNLVAKDLGVIKT